MAIKQILLPDIGNYSDVPVIEVLVNVGDSIQVDDSIITLESDKATMEIPSPYSGKLTKILVKEGDKVNQGDVIAEIEVAEDAAAELVPKDEHKEEAPAAAKTGEPRANDTNKSNEPRTETKPEPIKAAGAPTTAPVNAQPAGSRFHASPSVRAFARKLGADLSKITGTGPKGRITREDVEAYIKSVMQGSTTAAGSGTGIPPIPSIDFSQFGEIEEQELSRIKKISGKHLTSCWLNIPHVTQFDEADITELEDFRQSLKARAEKEGIKLTPLVFIMKAVAKVLTEYPQFNASLNQSADKLILKKYINIGIAVDTPNGLLVPVFKDVDKKGIFELSRELMETSKRAREGKLGPADLSGGSFSISSLGGIGGTQFTPIVNAPEVAILGVSKAKMAPIWNGKEFVPRLMLPLALSYDHRVIDGAEGVRFITALSAILSDIRQLVL